jgi:hypothetical protein
MYEMSEVVKPASLLAQVQFDGVTHRSWTVIVFRLVMSYYGRWGYVLYSDAYTQTTRALARHQLRSLARYQWKALDVSTYNLYSACAHLTYIIKAMVYLDHRTVQ